MKYQDFLDSIQTDSPPAHIEKSLSALWHDRNGDWNLAHTIVQDIPSEIGSAVHAYLHREEGDIGNARYWYNRAGRREVSLSLAEEWESLVKEVLASE